MRDPERIPTLCEKVKTIWLRYPDLRFGQLTDALYSQVPEIPRTKEGHVDSFNVEDAVFEKVLDQVLEKGLR